MNNSTIKVFLVGAIIAAFVAMFGVSSPAYAEPEIPERYVDRLENASRVQQNFQGIHPSLASETGEVTVYVRLSGQSAADAYTTAMASGASEAELNASVQDSIATALEVQANVRTQLSGIDAIEIGAMQRAMNAMILYVPANNLDRLAALSNVEAVYPAPFHTISQNSSLPFHNVPSVWENEGNLGEGVSIGIIDTGIDYIHAGFGGDADYSNQTDPTTLADTGPIFPNAKVVGGYDFSGDDYDASGDAGSPIPSPDEDPTDCNGHGSHVAGTAAGYGVQGGVTFNGTYDTSLDLDTFDVPPGVAPEAELWALKVFGCDGSTNVTALAIEYAMDPNGDGFFDDRLDVINLSLGYNWGDPGSISETTINAAAQIGVVPVLAAGNDDENFFIHGGPGVASRGISVAAIQDDSSGTAQVTDGVESALAFPAAYGPDLTLITSQPLSVPVGNANGCAASDFDATASGTIALVDRGACNFTQKTLNAQAEGAIAVIITNVTTEVPFSPGGDAPGITIPTVMVSGTYGTYLKGQLPVSVTIDPAGLSLGNAIAGFSSLGPVRPDANDEVKLKPDIAAVGVDVTSVLTGYLGESTPNPGVEPLTIGGTSMATPHVAGMMAMLRNANPTWTVEELKAAIMNTANGYDDPVTKLDIATESLNEVSVTRQGSGRAEVGDALNTCIVAFGQDDPGEVSVSFDSLDILGDSTDVETIAIRNKCDSPVTIDATSIYLNVDTTGIDFVDGNGGASINVPAYATVTVEVAANYDHDAMLHERDDALTEIVSVDGFDEARHWIAEEGGYYVMEIGAETLIVPLYSAARPASSMSATGVTASPGAATIDLNGTQVANSGPSLSESNVSLVSGFELLYTDVDEDPTSDDLSETADFRHMGISHDGFGAHLGIETWDSWSTTDHDQFYICADLDQDGTGGAFANGVDWCWLLIGEAFLTWTETDAMMLYLWDINGFWNESTIPGFGGTGALYSWNYLNGLAASDANTRAFMNNVMFLPFETDPFLWSLYMNILVEEGAPFTTSGQDVSSEFDFYTYSFGYYAEGAGSTDISPVFRYDPNRATLNVDFSTGTPNALGVPAELDLDGAQFAFTHNSCDPSGATTAMLLHHHNVQGERAEAVPIEWTVDPNCPAFTGGAIAGMNMVDLDIDMSWPNPSNEDGILVERQQVGLNQYKFIADLPANTTQFTDDTAVCGKTYRYRITLYVNGLGFVEAFTNPVTMNCNLFNDVPSDLPAPFMEDWVNALYQAGITTGCAGGNYCPTGDVTRAEIAVFLVRALNYPTTGVIPADDPSDPFIDVPDPSQPAVFENFIEEFYDLGISGGCNAATGIPGSTLEFCPTDTISRADMAVFIVRALGVTPTDDPSDPFADIPDGSLPASFEAYIETFYNLGITTGKFTCQDGTTAAPGELLYCPNDTITRGEMAVFILRAFDDIPDPEDY